MPHVLDESEAGLVEMQRLGAPAEVVLDAGVLPVDFLALVVGRLWCAFVIGVVEDLDAEHVEAGVVAAGDANVVEIIEAKTELALDKRVTGRIGLAGDAEGLVAVDAGCNKVDIATPSGYNGIAWNNGVRNTCGGE